MSCQFYFGGRNLMLTAEQRTTLARDDLADTAIEGFMLDCTVNVSGDVRLSDGRWLKLNGMIEDARWHG